MPLNLPDQNLSIFTIPKNGTTTLRNWVYFIRTGGKTAPGTPPANIYKQEWLVDNKLHKETVLIRRDPVERFLSGYRNFRDRRGLKLEFDEFVNKFPRLLLKDENIRHHFRPQSSYRTVPLAAYDHVFDFSSFAEIKAFLEERSGMELPDKAYQKSRFRDFEVTAEHEHWIREYYKVDYARGYAEGHPIPKINRNGSAKPKEEFHVILSTMRAGSSLFGNLLAASGQALYAGEMQVPIKDELGIRKSMGKILTFGDGRRREAPLCDKVLHHWLLPDGGNYLISRANRFYLLLRHPLAVLRSGKQTNWDSFSMDYLHKQWRCLRKMVEKIDPEKLKVVSYYDLVSADKRAEFFGQDVDSYKMVPFSGRPGRGDPGKLIRTGVIRNRSLKEDLAVAVKETWMDLERPKYQRTMEEYRKVLALVGRKDLDMEIPDVEASGLLAGASPERLDAWGNPDQILRMDCNDLHRGKRLPVADNSLRWIGSEDLFHRTMPKPMSELLREFHRMLAPNGFLRISTIDLDFVYRLAMGGEPNYAEWYGRTFLDGTTCESRVAHHLQQNWGHQFLYSRAMIEKLLLDAGFEGIKEVEPDERESINRFPENFYRVERYVVECRKAL